MTHCCKTAHDNFGISRIFQAKRRNIRWLRNDLRFIDP
jgi:hypothetical protein